MTVRNTSAVVDSFNVNVLGDAADWTTVTPAALSLFPGADGTVEIRFRPPRAASLAAGPIDFAVRVASSQFPDESVVEEGVLSIEPFVEIAARITPRNSEAKRKARHVVTVDNRGNAPITVSVAASDPDEALAFAVEPSSLTVEPGDSASATIAVAARASAAKGAAQHRPFQAVVTPPATSMHPPTVLDAAFVQKGGVKSILPVIAAAAVILVVAAVVVPGLLSKKDEKGGTFTLSSAANDTTTTAPAGAAGGEDDSGDAEAEVAAGSGGGGGASPNQDQQAAATTAPPTTAAATGGGSKAAPTTTAQTSDDAPATTVAAKPTVAALPRPKAGLPVLFPSFEGDTDEEIWKINPDGSGKQKLTNFPQPQWSVGARWNYPGTLIAFTHANGPVHVWIMNADGSNQHDATPTCGTNCSQPAFSADGSLLAYARETSSGSGTYDIWVADVSPGGATSNHRALVNSGDNEQYPAFAPDGRLAYQRFSGAWKVIVRATNGTETGVAAGQQPAWSPNNDRLLYSDGNDIWSMTVPGTATNITAGTSSAEQWPIWSPDGGTIGFSTTRWGAWHVALADPSGGNVRQLTSGSWATGTSGQRRHWWIGWI